MRDSFAEDLGTTTGEVSSSASADLDRLESRIMPPQSWILAVRTKLTKSLDLEFSDRASLVAQLARFNKRGLSDPYRLHEFRNDSGVVIAFISKAYVSHSVMPPLHLVS